ncbi:hypothetical protein MD484_g1871, partial [Candolleomyces efflorescens]
MAASNSSEFPYASSSVLPVELVDSLNQVYFLHRLATEPERVIPPGKTLLSMMIQSQIDSGKPTEKQETNLVDRVKEVAHRAFWNEAIESLSSPQPSVQLPRLKRLYGDLAESLAPLFPPDHKIMQFLQAHLPPTTSPLHYALEVLKELLKALRERCAPIRDETIDQLYTKLDEWRDPIPERIPPHSEDHSELSGPRLAALIVDTVKAIVSLAEYMKSDLNTAILGSMGEQEVKGFVLQQAKVRERGLIVELWSANQSSSGQVLREKWRTWLVSASTEGIFSQTPPDRQWIVRLMEQLGTNISISCDLPTSFSQGSEQSTTNSTQTPSNEVPPHFFFVAPKLHYIQNYLQAITIAASLRILAQVPGPRGHEFLDRVWSLLKMEIDEDVHGPPSELGATKIINLADEVVRIKGPLDANQDAQLREAVERTLRPQDPVFMLLHRRLTEGLTRQLLEYMAAAADGTSRPTGRAIPDTLKTGRTIGAIPVKRPKVGFPDHLDLSPRSSAEGATAPVVVKGFEDPLLVSEIQSVLREIIVCTTWVGMVWGDLVCNLEFSNREGLTQI